MYFTLRSHAPDPNARMETDDEPWQRLDAAQANSTPLNYDGEEYSSGSYDDEDGSCTDEEDGSEEEESEEEEEEPVLKYRRFAKEVVDSLSQGSSHDSPTKNVIVCMAIHTKFIVLGTYDGTIKVLDHNGTVMKDREYALHNAPINQISVNEHADFMACCSQDGKVSIIGLLSTKHNNTMQFDRVINAVAIHPHFGRGGNTFVAGSNKLVMVEERRWPLGNKVNELHQGYGISPITTIKWRDNYIAWAYDKAVYVYDIGLRDMIASIKYEEESPIRLPCSLCWVKNGTLLVGKGHFVKVAEVKEMESMDQLAEYSGGGTVPIMKKRKHMAIVAQNSFPDFLVSGVVPIIQEGVEGYNLVVLGYDAKVDQDTACHSGVVPPPHIIVIPPGKYIASQQQFDSPAEITRDKLLPRGYGFCKCTELFLECVMTTDEDRFYFVTPIDIILAQKRGNQDHLQWLIDKEKFKGAAEFVANPSNCQGLTQERIQEVKLLYIYHLIKSCNFDDAAKKCADVLGPKDGERWEDIILKFLDQAQIPVILPFIPKENPRLSAVTYELVLNFFLVRDTKVFHQIVKEWPPDLYSTETIMNALSDQMKKHEDAALEKEVEYHPNTDLLKVKAKLYEDMGNPNEALNIYLRLGDTEMFHLIRKRNLHNALLENIRYLMKLGDETLKKTVELLVEFRENKDGKEDDCLPPSRVVKKLDSFKSDANTNWEFFLHKYLDALFDKDPKAGSEYHERQVQLYADYERKKLLPFLRACNDIPLQKALDVCESKDLHEAMVFLLDRMGNPKASLQIIVGKLSDVDKAILFVREKDDEELWDELIKLSRDLPDFITGLLRNAGTHIDPTKLIKEIPDRLEITNLGLSIVKLLSDYQLQVNLREGCKKILVKDSYNLMEKLHRLHNRSVFFDSSTICNICGGAVSSDDDERILMFFCGHVYHHRCVVKKAGRDICHLCYRSSGTSQRSIRAVHGRSPLQKRADMQRL